MARVDTRATPLRTRESVSDKLKRRKKPFKVVLESITQEKKKLVSVVSYHHDAPVGYTFVPAGTPDLTERCKELSRSRGIKVFVVSAARKDRATKHPDHISSHIQRVGYHFASEIVDQACDWLGYQYDGRSFRKVAAVLDTARWTRQNRQLEMAENADSTAARNEHIENLIKDLFPLIPEKDLKAIIKHAFQEGTSRVGNASDLPLSRRVQLAVIAHIRHTYTDYDKLLKQVSYVEARQRIEPICLARLREWRGEDQPDDEEFEDVFREVIVLDDSDDESDAESQADRDSSLEIVTAAAAPQDLVHDDQADAYEAGWQGRPSKRLLYLRPREAHPPERVMMAPQYSTHHQPKKRFYLEPPRLPPTAPLPPFYAPHETYSSAAPQSILVRRVERPPDARIPKERAYVSHPQHVEPHRHPPVHVIRERPPLPPPYSEPLHRRPVGIRYDDRPQETLQYAPHRRVVTLLPHQAAPRRSPIRERDMALPSIEHDHNDPNMADGVLKTGYTLSKADTHAAEPSTASHGQKRRETLQEDGFKEVHPDIAKRARMQYAESQIPRTPDILLQPQYRDVNRQGNGIETVDLTYSSPNRAYYAHPSAGVSRRVLYDRPPEYQDTARRDAYRPLDMPPEHLAHQTHRPTIAPIPTVGQASLHARPGLPTAAPGPTSHRTGAFYRDAMPIGHVHEEVSGVRYVERSRGGHPEQVVIPTHSRDSSIHKSLHASGPRESLRPHPGHSVDGPPPQPVYMDAQLYENHHRIEHPQYHMRSARTFPYA